MKNFMRIGTGVIAAGVLVLFFSGCKLSAKYSHSKKETVSIWYETPVDAETLKKADSSSTYIYFGVFPKTIVPEDEDGTLYNTDRTAVITIDETVSVTMGANTYYKGSDGSYYAKVVANPSSESYTYSDGSETTKNVERYFKVEPIKWRVLDKSTGLILAEDVITASTYYNSNSADNVRSVGEDTRIYPNNYKYSTVRAYLNGLEYYYDESSTKTTLKSEYKDCGFLQTAFTESARSRIKDTDVDNSADSTTDYSGDFTKATLYADSKYNTTDKIFLLSLYEVTNPDYGFSSKTGSDSSRVHMCTDFALANYLLKESGSGNRGYWIIRSPYYDNKDAVGIIFPQGSAGGRTYPVKAENKGIVPALTLSF